MGAYRKLSKEQKISIVEEALNGKASKSAVARKHQIAHGLLYHWIEAYEQGGFENKPTYEAGYLLKIEKLEQMVGRQAMEIEFLKKAIKFTRLKAQKKEHLSKNTGYLPIVREGGAN